MRLRAATAADHPDVVVAIGSWWGDRDLTSLVQPLFLGNFASTSLVAEDADGSMCGFLIGFPSVDDPEAAYVHFLGVRPDVRGAGLGRTLHSAFAEAMAARGVTTVRCVTSPVNTDSVAFHTSIGFVVESVDEEYVHLVHHLEEHRAARFAPRPDPRPGDGPWPEAHWPPAASTVLAGRHVTLRPSTPEDAPGLYAALDDDLVWAHVRGRPDSVDGMAAIVAAAGRFPWTVRIGDRVVGTTSYLEVSPVDARLEIGFTLYAPEVWGTTVNPECKLLLMSWAFDHGFGRVQLKTDIRNARSQQAISRLGAEYEGVLRRYQRRQDGSVRDSVLFSVTAEDWPAVRAGLEERLREV